MPLRSKTSDFAFASAFAYAYLLVMYVQVCIGDFTHLCAAHCLVSACMPIGI